MRNILKPALAAAVLIGSGAGLNAAPRLTPEQQLARKLEGRVAREPVRCIDTSRVVSSEIIRGIGIVYDAGSTIYVNRPDAGAESLHDSDILVTRTFGSQLCDNDVVHLVDPASRMGRGAVFLGKFVPYKKAKASG